MYFLDATKGQRKLNTPKINQKLALPNQLPPLPAGQSPRFREELG